MRGTACAVPSILQGALSVGFVCNECTCPADFAPVFQMELALPSQCGGEARHIPSALQRAAPTVIQRGCRRWARLLCSARSTVAGFGVCQGAGWSSFDDSNRIAQSSIDVNPLCKISFPQLLHGRFSLGRHDPPLRQRPAAMPYRQDGVVLLVHLMGRQGNPCNRDLTVLTGDSLHLLHCSRRAKQGQPFPLSTTKFLSLLTLSFPPPRTPSFSLLISPPLTIHTRPICTVYPRGCFYIATSLYNR